MKKRSKPDSPHTHMCRGGNGRENLWGGRGDERARNKRGG